MGARHWHVVFLYGGAEYEREITAPTKDAAKRLVHKRYPGAHVVHVLPRSD